MWLELREAGPAFPSSWLIVFFQHRFADQLLDRRKRCKVQGVEVLEVSFALSLFVRVLAGGGLKYSGRIGTARIVLVSQVRAHPTAQAQFSLLSTIINALPITSLTTRIQRTHGIALGSWVGGRRDLLTSAVTNA